MFVSATTVSPPTTTPMPTTTTHVTPTTPFCDYDWGVDDPEKVPTAEIELTDPANPSGTIVGDVIRPSESSFSTFPYGSVLFKIHDTEVTDIALTPIGAIRIEGDNLDTAIITVVEADQEWHTLVMDHDISSGDFTIEPPVHVYQVRIVFTGTPSSGYTFTGIGVDLYGCWESEYNSHVPIVYTPYIVYTP